MDIEKTIKEDTTFMVSTCFRPLALHDLLQSLRTHYPETPIIIADDSDEPYPGIAKGYDPVTYLTPGSGLPELEIDEETGETVGHGAPLCYNYMLDHIKTKYVVLLDDDFVFTERTNIRHWFKFIDSYKVEDYEVYTPNGWENIEAVGKTVPYRIWYLKTESFELKCADNHIVFDQDFNELYVKNINTDDLIQTENGPERVLEVYETVNEDNMYDIQLSKGNNRY